jgi:Domain of unknown function (DUF1906)
MRFFRLVAAVTALGAVALSLSIAARLPQSRKTSAPTTYLGFDLNQYPGDSALPVLCKTFSFTSYWIGPPPGEKQSTWLGKRELLRSQGFGFVVLFNGPESRTLKTASSARIKGATDAEQAAKLAEQEGFNRGTTLFLDIEEGGRLPMNYHEYVKAWSQGLKRAGYRAGVYCSAMPVNEGKGVSITTAQGIQDHVGSAEIVFWVYNDACPPSPGCTFPAAAPSPAQSGFANAAVWQYAQSPRRKEFTSRCPANYAADGNCYAPGDSAHKWFLDVNAASSADPSSAK